MSVLGSVGGKETAGEFAQSRIIMPLLSLIHTVDWLLIADNIYIKWLIKMLWSIIDYEKWIKVNSLEKI